MKHIGLFEGIGGFSLSARWIGWETIAWCEIDPFCQKVLKYHFPNAKAHGDIRKTDFTIYRGKCGIITGGFPCQPFSVAGKRKGTEDDRHLWPEMLRAIREIRPRWIVGENVRGIVNWSGGLVFEQVQDDLEVEGYEVQSFILPACAVNAPHRRDRVWFVAYRANAGIEGVSERKNDICKTGVIAHSDDWSRQKYGFSTGREMPKNCTKTNRPTPDAKKPHKLRNGICKEQQERPIRGQGSGVDTKRVSSNPIGSGWIQNNIKQQSTRAESIIPGWEWFPTQSPICGRNDGISSRLDGITFPKLRRESIKALGNAIVPQVAFEIFKAIEEYENQV